MPSPDPADADLERRFGGLRRLHGDAAYARLRAGRFAVVGVGGVGSWAAEALARCGVAGLTLLDGDQVAESNINRQVQALGATAGMAKVQALAARLRDIHPGCAIEPVDAFIEPGQDWPATAWPDVILDCCDQQAAKAWLVQLARARGAALVCVGAAGGKRRPQDVECADLAEVTHDPLLAGLRQRLRQRHGAPRRGPIGVRCVFSREAVQRPTQACELDGSLNCQGYGSTVTVTATFGLVAAQAALDAWLVGSGGLPKLHETA